MGWLFMYLVLPAISPLLVMALMFVMVRDRYLPEVQPLINWLTPIKDGQLCWLGIAFCSQAIYELFEANMRAHEPFNIVAGICLSFLMFGNGVLIAGGSVSPSVAPQSARRSLDSRWDLLLYSLVACMLSGASLAWMHFVVLAR